MEGVKATLANCRQGEALTVPILDLRRQRG